MLIRIALAIGILSAPAVAFSLSDSVRIERRIDYDLGVVFLEEWRGDHYLGVADVVPLGEYLDYQLRESVVANWRRQAKLSREQRELSFDSQGLIPDIELPTLPVFGEGSRIDISGQDRITLGGRQTVVEGIRRDTTRPRALPELKMEQQLSVRLNGTIGERTTVSIDHDSERREAQNKIKLAYAGTEDEVVQSVEVGDTRLTIPGTGYTGDLPAHKGLFGVSARGKLAGVDLYAIASREESQAQTQEFTGRRRVSVDTIYAKEFLRNRFFRVNVAGEIRNLRLYHDDKNYSNNEAAIPAIATVYPNRPDSIPVTWSYDRTPGDFDLKTMGTDFVLHPGKLLELARTLGSSDVLAAVIFTERDTLGGQLHSDSLVLTLLKPEVPDSLSEVWEAEARNVYALPQSDVELNSIRLFRENPDGEDTEYETEGSNKNRKFLEILGLDPDGDGRLEYPEFDPQSGFIRFPVSMPFDDTVLSVRDRMLYRKSILDPEEGKKYYLVVEYSSAAEAYYLGQTDIERESERVLVDNVQWTRGVDYDIDYVAGILTFLRALPAEANIRVTYEYRPWFSMSQKSLLGARAEYALGEDGKIGSSIFYRNEGIPDDRPVLGAEPFQRMIAEADASYSAVSDGVSAFLDRLPLLRAQAPSRLSASAEGAVSFPDPNTGGSAYLDDFETTTITRDVTMNALLWYHASVPVGRDSSQFAAAPLYWATPGNVRKDSVFGAELGDEGRQTQEYLRVAFRPDDDDPETSWAGIMNSPSQLGLNLKDLENLEIILRSRQRSGNLHVSLGMSIDEDAPRRNRSGEIVGLNGRMDSEDRDLNGQLTGEQEDTGLDTVFGEDDSWFEGSGDDGNDDYDPVRNPSGTEGNQHLDAEDLDRNGFSRYNHYFECVIPLGDEQYVTSLYNGWELYRVSLSDSAAFRRTGSPKWEDIRIVRVWFDGFAITDTIDFFSIQFVGSKWRDPAIRRANDSIIVPDDTTTKVWVAAVSKKTDTTYVSPFELKRDIYGEQEQEAALVFGYRRLYGGLRATCNKTAAEPDDYREYTQMRLYVHDDGSGLDFLVRMGPDSVNFYEYHAPITEGELVPGADGRWFEFTIPLDSLPRLKAQRDSFAGPESTWSRGRFAVRGNPTLSDIRYMALGIENLTGRPKSGGIWFDDIRLTTPNRDPGVGFQARTSIALSDFVTADAAFAYSDPNFRRFSEGRGVKTGGFGATFSSGVGMQLDRLLPHEWGLSVPLTYNLSRRSELPKYSARHPDLRLTRQQAGDELISGSSHDYGLDNLRKERSGNRWLNYTIEAMNFSWRERRGANRGVLARDSTASRSIDWSYSVNPELLVELSEDGDLYLFPQDIRLGINHGSRRDLRSSRLTPQDTWRTDSAVARDVNADISVDYSPIDDLSFDYSISSERDLEVAESEDTLFSLPIGSEASQEQSVGVSFSPEVADFLAPSVDLDATFSGDRPKEERAYVDYRNINNEGDIDLGLGVDLPELLDRFVPERPRRPDTGEVGKPAPNPIRAGAEWLSRSLDPVDLEYNISRSSDLFLVYGPIPWQYRFGLVDGFEVDTAEYPQPPSSETRDLSNSFRAASGIRVGELKAGATYDWSRGRNTSIYSRNVDEGYIWPDLDVQLGKVHKLFQKLASDSRLSSRYRVRNELSGDVVRDSLGAFGDTLALLGRVLTRTTEFSPLLSWQTTWQKRVSTTVSADYTFSTQTNFLNDDGTNYNVTNGRTRGANLSLSYSFSAPQGLRLPFLRRVRFSSDLRLSGSLRYSQSNRWLLRYDDQVQSDSSDLSSDRAWSTKLTASYNFSRAVEAGFNVGYSYTKGLTPYATRTTDLDIWVLFRF